MTSSSGRNTANVSKEARCERLLATANPTHRDRLRKAVATSAAGGVYLLAAARTALVSDPIRALACATEAAEIALLRADPQQEATAWRVRGQALRVQGRHTDAILAFETAASRADTAQDPALAAQVQIGAIDSLGQIGRVEEGITLGRRLEAELQRLGRNSDVAKVLVNVGNLYTRQDRYAGALDCLERALPLLDGEGEVLAAAQVRANTAEILTYLNRSTEAHDLYIQAGRVFAEAGQKADSAMLDANIGYLRYLMGEHTQALSALVRARQEFANLGYVVPTAKCDLDMADVYRELNLFPEALECYTRAIRVFAGIPLAYEQARAEKGLAVVLMAMGRTEAAFEALERASQRFQAAENRPQNAHIQLIRASIFQSLGRDEEAQIEAERATRAFMATRQAGWAAEAKLILAQLRLKAGLNATRRLQHIAKTASEHARLWLVCRAEQTLGRHFVRENNAARALRHFRTSMQALEKARSFVVSEELHVSFLRDKLSVYEDLIRALLTRGRAGDVREALEYVERAKSRLLLERVQGLWEGPEVPRSDAAREAQRNLAVLRAELSRSYHRIAALNEGDTQRQRGMNPLNIEALHHLEKMYRDALRERELLEGTLRTLRSEPSATVRAAHLQSALGPDETLVEYYIAGDEVCAFVVTPQRVKIQRNVASYAEIAHASRRLRYHLQRADLHRLYPQQYSAHLDMTTEAVLKQFYNLLFKPLEALLTTEKIVLIPHGLLHGLPFHAFHDGSSHLLDRFEFLYAPSAALWRMGVERKQREQPVKDSSVIPDEVLLMGVPTPGITQVTEEIESIARLLPEAHIFCAESATIAAFRKYAPLCRWIHLATHALFRADNPLFSGLRFTDEWLMAQDLYTIPLNCDLATLSACRTGATFVKTGDEQFGLLRGFLVAGARSVAASLWLADDAATAALMRRFYSLLAQGIPKAAALRAAQRDMRTEYSHPYYWASFALIGER